MKPPSLKPPPRRGSQTRAQLRELQRQALAAIRHPLTRSGDMESRWTDGRATSKVISEFIKPNDRLSSFERLQIYNRQYWYRLMDCLWDDYPGLRAILGPRKFEELRTAYLNRYPSRSYTLRNLGSCLAQFIAEEPHFTQPRLAMCLDMAAFEWAQVVAFDAEALPPLSVDGLLGKDPRKLRVALQPYITLLELRYPLDDFVLAVKKRDASLRSEASNAVQANRETAEPARIRLPRPKETYLAVHRHDDSLYYKRLEPAAYLILTKLRDGASLAHACAAAVSDDGDASQRTAQLRHWFANWTELGWFCTRSKR
jgi:hypothetical protein